MTARKQISLLVVTQYFYPEQFRINDMCQEWVKRGYDVTVVTGIPNYPRGKFFDGYGWFKRRKEVFHGVNVIRLPILSRGSSKIKLGLNYLSFAVTGFFWKLFTKQKADLVFAFEVSPMIQVLPAIWFAKRRKIPCIAYIQDLWPENFIEMTGIENGLIIDIVSQITDYIYQNCNKILVTSPSFKKAVEERDVPINKVDYWPQYAEEFYQPSNTLSPIVSADTRFTVVFTGNVGTSQGLDILPRTAALLKSQAVQVRFLIVGNGRGMPLLRSAIESENVGEYFTFIPQQSPQIIPDILAHADAAFVSFANKPLFAMTIPAKLQSYMACGMPILAAAGGETAQVIIDAGCGLICNAGDAEALTDNIKKMIEVSDDTIVQWSNNAKEYADRYYNKMQLMDVMDNLLQASLFHGR